MFARAAARSGLAAIKLVGLMLQAVAVAVELPGASGARGRGRGRGRDVNVAETGVSGGRWCRGALVGGR